MNIKYTNLKKEFPKVSCYEGFCRELVSIDRYWAGKLIHISIKHHLFVIDLRGKNWLKDLISGSSNS